jgi:N utilization substance protein A
VKLSEVIEELVEERGLDRTVLGSIISEGILAAYKKRYPEVNIQVNYDKKTDEIKVTVEKTVVSAVADEDNEISVRKAKFIDKNADLGEKVSLPFEGAIGRIEILRAKQVIATKIRDIEAAGVYNEFKDKEGDIVIGTIHKCERNGVSVKLQENLAFLPKSLTIPGDKCVVGMPIRALLKEVLAEPRNENQLILDRTSPEFLTKLFELEIPEVYEKLVEIKKIARIPGYKSKIVVISHDKNIDPVGTCVGVGGVRIKPVLKELSNEKIDVISGSDDLETLVRDALKPADINRVEVVDEHNARVWLNEDQRSLAIGRMGQNIQLASQLTGLNIHLMADEPTQKNEEQEDHLSAEHEFERD